ncbi:MAG: ABC transporter substrate-binding protein [Verrucomicrobiota bacterium]
MKKFHTRLIGSLFALLLVVLLSGCGKSSAPSAGGNSGGGSSAGAASDAIPLPENPQPAYCEPGIRGGRLVIASFGEPKTFNPITANDTSSQEIYRLLFGTLLYFDWPTQDVKPALAESWSVADDQKTWTFKLRKGVQWSDGLPFTADDVIFTWEIIYHPDINNVTRDAFMLDGKKFEVTKVDDHTIKVVTPAPYAPFLENFGGGVYILPKHILSKVPAKSFEATYGINTPPAELVGCGPFLLKEFKPGQLMLLERNPRYWVVDKKGQRLPYFDNIIFTIVPDMNAMSLRFRKGESDVFEYVRPDEYVTYKEESDQGKYQLLDLGTGLERGFFWFNQNTGTNPKTGKPYVDPKKLKWFRNTKFRQAMAYAVDRPSLIKSIYAGRAKPNFGYITEANKRWVADNLPQYNYSVAKARALLGEIGIRDRDGDGFLEDDQGNVIEFVLNTNTGNNTRDKIAVLVQSDLKRLGLKVIYQPIEFNTLVDKIDTSYDYECILLGLGGGSTDPSASMNVLRSDGFTHQWFPRQKSPSTKWEERVDFLMNEQLKILDYKERKKVFDEVQMILAEEVPMIYTVSPYVYAGVRNGLGNLRGTALSAYRATWNAEELYWKEKR